MMCCRCDITGSCRDYASAKGRRKCYGCQPNKTNRCQNSPSCTPLSLSPQLLSSPSPANAPSTSCSSSQEKAQLEINSYSSIPDYNPAARPTFNWGIHNGEAFSEELHKIHSEVVHWKPNLSIPSYGNVGSQFVSEITKSFMAFATASVMESIAMMAATVMPLLLLQNHPKFQSQ